MGNRGEFATPGMQWISVGSGIEHAEGGATDELSAGFQIWINVPSSHKMDDPQYGVEPPENIPTITTDNSVELVLAGEHKNKAGPFHTKQPLQMIDYTLKQNSSITHQVPVHLDNCMIFIYSGAGNIGTSPVKKFDVLHMDATDPTLRNIVMSTDSSEMKLMLFAGKKINEPIAWHGPFVMNTQAEIQQTINEYRQGKFPPKRVPWDYTRLDAFPDDHPARSSALIKDELR